MGIEVFKILSLFQEIFFELVISTLNGISEFSDLKKWLTFDLLFMEMWKPLVVSLSLWINKSLQEEQNIPGLYSVK